MILKFMLLGILSNGYYLIDEEICKLKGYGILFEIYEISLIFICVNQCLDSDLNWVIIGCDE